MSRLKRITSVSGALLLTALLAACGGPRTQDGSSTALDGKNTVQDSGVIIDQEEVGAVLSATEIAAAKARVPHQYDEHEPLSLFDFNTNLNPQSNR